MATTCPQCGNETTPGAAFCGNCGQALIVKSAPEHHAETPDQLPHRPGSRKAVAAIIFGVAALAGWLIPILGLAIGVTAVILGTTSYRTPRRQLAVAGTLLGCLGIVLSLGAWAYFVQNSNKEMAQLRNGQSQQASAAIETLCYATSADVQLNAVSNSSSTCLYDANDLATGDEYTVKAVTVTGITTNNLATVSQTDIDSFTQKFPGVTVDSSEAEEFAGRPAYTYRLGNLSGSTATITYVIHDSPTGYNLFIIARFSNGEDASLTALERNWEWK